VKNFAGNKLAFEAFGSERKDEREQRGKTLLPCNWRDGSAVGRLASGPLAETQCDPGQGKR
jgi:hypothetical protein